jgi:RNA polymerase sigma-70 factor (ECF subfamily)
VAPADFEELCELSYTRVAKAAFLILGDRQEALDVAQEAFSRALERWEEVGSMENPEGWIYRVAVNLSLSTRRRAVRWVKGRIPDRPALEPEPSDPALAQALSRLTPAQRAAVVLRFYSDLSIADTALALNKRPGTVRALTAQGVSRLRDDLGPTWLEEHDEQPIP